jgi:hypothetical protein
VILQTYGRILASLLFVLIGVSAAQKSRSAMEQFQNLKAELQKSHSAKDWQSNLASETKLQELLNAAPNSLLEVARAEVGVGDLDAAFREVEGFVRMGQSADLLATSPDFSPLLRNANFAQIQSAMEANRSAISLGSTDFLLSDSGLLAEDVDYDPHTKRFFITSVREKKIVSVKTGGASTDFAKAPDNWPMLAIKVDPSRNVLLATEVAIQGFSFAAESDWGRSAVLCYDLKSGNLLRRAEGPRGTAWAI